MSVIVIFGGTSEGRVIAEKFRNTNLEMHVCVATEYGGTLLPECPNVHVHSGRMDEHRMEIFLKELDADYCIDATHPYAAAVTENIFNACRNSDIQYIRVVRKEGESFFSGNEDVRFIYRRNLDEAVSFLNDTTGNIFITTGSKELEKYTGITGYKDRCYARVLPTISVMEKCTKLGFEGKNLICMQGPFDEEFNYLMLKHTCAAWLVTKNSGKEGGYQEKCEAAVKAGVNVLVIGRPPEKNENVMYLNEVIEFLQNKYKTDVRRKVYLIGMGPGKDGLLTKRAEEILDKSDVIIGAKRILDIWPKYLQKPFFRSYNKEEIAEYLNKNNQYGQAALIYSGDMGFYSGASGMRELLKEYDVEAVPGIASPVYFLDKIGIPWEAVKLVSCHGKNINLLSQIKYNEKVCTLIGNSGTIRETCGKLMEYHMENVEIIVGERLSYDNERILRGFASDFIDLETDSLSVALFINRNADNYIGGNEISDREFIRGNVPMTKQEIRTLSLAKLRLSSESVLYDIGAGTGSVSVEASFLCREGTVYAIEKKSDAVSLIYENKIKFSAVNLDIVEGEAPDCLDELPAPTHAFIGGSSGRLIDIIGRVREKNRNVRFVINAVTLETISQMEKIKELFPEYGSMEIVQVNVSRNKPLGRYNLMSAENPVYIVSFGGGKEKADYYG